MADDASVRLKVMMITVVAYQNQKISSYWLDNMVQPDRPDIWRFLLERWDMLIAMSMVLSIFVINESHRANVAA